MTGGIARRASGRFPRAKGDVIPAAGVAACPHRGIFATTFFEMPPGQRDVRCNASLRRNPVSRGQRVITGGALHLHVHANITGADVCIAARRTIRVSCVIGSA
jgi:hypothetical protein